MKHDECSNYFGNYILGCYYDPFPPHLLSGDFFHFENGDISLAECIKECGEAGFMLAGLRWDCAELKLKIEILRDRQFCHCGNVEPPLEFVRGWDMCGTSCPPTPMSPPPQLGIVENCGTSLHTMVSFRSLEKNCRTILLRSTPPPTPTTPSGIVRPKVVQRLENSAYFLSRSLEGENTFTFTELEGTDI